MWLCKRCKREVFATCAAPLDDKGKIIAEKIKTPYYICCGECWVGGQHEPKTDLEEIAFWSPKVTPENYDEYEEELEKDEEKVIRLPQKPRIN